jgi:transposase
MGVAVGIDSHKSSLGAAVVDELGRLKDAREFSNDPRGHRAAREWMSAYGAERVVGIEGSGRYGAGFARVLIAHGEEVKEVPAFLTHRERKKAPSKGKSDLGDALAVARVVSRGEGLSTPERNHVMVDLKLLSDRRDELVRARTQAANRAHKDLVVVRPGYEAVVPKLTRTAHLQAARRLLRGDQSVRAELIRDHLRDIERLSKGIAEVTKRLTAKVIESGTSLTTLKGIGFVLAAKILGEVGDPRRFRSRDAFAMFNGTAPLEASSGQSKRHRHNRGGNRKLNYALHMMAVALHRSDSATRTFVARQKKTKTLREALRCLKRHLSNVVYRQLIADVAEIGSPLRVGS